MNSTPSQTIRGTTRLVFDYVEGVTDTVEKMHETIARRPLPWTAAPQQPSRAHGLIAAAVYKTIRGVNGALREIADQGLALLPAARAGRETRAEVQAMATLNGVCGDHLEETGNPLAITMRFSTLDQGVEPSPHGLRAVFPEATPHLVLFVHGLCMSELSWQRSGHPGMGSRLQQDRGETPVYLRYNTGRHISTNGRDFAALLERLCRNWPVPVESLSLIGHSMGGLVIRSACWHAEQASMRWLEGLRRIVCLGTPHHGAPLEQAGHLFDAALTRNPYVEPLLFGRQRSAGIKDLRYGNLLDEDWQDSGQNARGKDNRRPVPTLPGVDYYFIAATVGRDEHDLRGHVLGDLLVRMDSATGSHRDALKHIELAPENCHVFHGMNHFGLLDDERVQQQVVDWFSRQT